MTFSRWPSGSTQPVSEGPYTVGAHAVRPYYPDPTHFVSDAGTAVIHSQTSNVTFDPQGGCLYVTTGRSAFYRALLAL
jgi:hypothetical protein